jgi:hypothetical protein
MEKFLILPFKELSSLFLKSYEKLINNYTNEKARLMTTGFLDFSWSGMSSGEVAF